MRVNIISDDQPIDPDDERLVAYLDGELELEPRNRLEDELVENSKLRQRLKELQGGWDYLGDLTVSTPNEKLVQTTMELVVADLVDPNGSPSSWWARSRFPFAVIVASFVAAIVGLQTIASTREASFQKELKDLQIAENLDAYLDGADLDLMRDLERNDQWKLMVDAAKAISGIDDSEEHPLSGVGLEQRVRFLQDLSPDDASSLSAKWERFRTLTADTQRQIRETANKVDVQSDSQSLLQTMRDYSKWRVGLPSELIDVIEGRSTSLPSSGDSLAPITRSIAISQAIQGSMAQMKQRSSDQLNDETVELINIALHNILHNRVKDEESAASKWSSFERNRPRRRPITGDTIEAIVISRIVQPPRGGRGRRGDEPRQRPSPLSGEELGMIEVMLPPEVRDQLDIWDSLVRAEFLRAWAIEASQRTFRPEELSLLERYELLPDPLDLAPPEKIIDELSRQRFRRGPRSPLNNRPSAPPRTR